jgi:hypothetical protein
MTRRQATTTTARQTGLEFPLDLGTAIDRTIEMGVHFSVYTDGAGTEAGEPFEGLPPSWLATLGFWRMSGDVVGDVARYTPSGIPPSPTIFGPGFVVVSVRIDGETCWGSGVNQTSPLAPPRARRTGTWLCFDLHGDWGEEAALALASNGIPHADGIPVLTPLASHGALHDLWIAEPGAHSVTVPLAAVMHTPALENVRDVIGQQVAFTDALFEVPVELSVEIREDGRVAELDARLELEDFYDTFIDVGTRFGIDPTRVDDARAQLAADPGWISIRVIFEEHHAPSAVFRDRIASDAQGERYDITLELAAVGAELFDLEVPPPTHVIDGEV